MLDNKYPLSKSLFAEDKMEKGQTQTPLTHTKLEEYTVNFNRTNTEI